MAELLTREQILGADDLPTETVEVPEWGGAVRVRGLTGAERDALESSMISQHGKDVQIKLANLRAKLVVRSIVDVTGARVFSDDGDVMALGRKSALALQRVFEVAQRLSGLTAADVEELTKNSESGQSDDSGSGSPSL